MVIFSNLVNTRQSTTEKHKPPTINYRVSLTFAALPAKVLTKVGCALDAFGKNGSITEFIILPSALCCEGTKSKAWFT